MRVLLATDGSPCSDAAVDPPLGDPIEIAGLTKAFQSDGGSDAAVNRNSCPIGSVKSNIGHLEAAAGATRTRADGGMATSPAAQPQAN